MTDITRNAAFNAAQKQAKERLEALRAYLDDPIAGPRSTGPTWGDIGSMRQVADDLDKILDFVLAHDDAPNRDERGNWIGTVI